MSLAEFDADVVIDARDCILGRVASHVAERALDGESIAVVGAEEVVITGDDEDVMDVYETRREMGSDRGPYYPKRPDRIMKRSIKGMIPHKTARGREALEGVRVYVGDPYEHDDEIENTVLEETTIDRLSNTKFVQLGEVADRLGANVTW